jgi:hypothetical protein
MSKSLYPKTDKFPDLDHVYTQCGRPGGLKLTEFMAEKMGLHVQIDGIAYRGEKAALD